MIERIVLFGATGDLTARLLLPSLAVLLQDGEVPTDLKLLGLARSSGDTEWFRREMATALTEHASPVDAAVRATLVQALEYQTIDVTASEEVAQALSWLDRPALFYLALAPHLFEPTLHAMARAGFPAGSLIAVEKPFGHDLASAKRLNALLHQHFPDTTVFRVDHFLSDGLVQQVAALRFANRIFEPLWSNQHIDRVDIIWDETLSLEGRAAYYDTAGALKDMLQNHLLEVLAILAMDQPAPLDEPSLRGARVAVLRAIPSLSAQEAGRRSVRGRYTAGSIQGRPVPSYADEPGVDPGRQTETFAQVTLEVANWRWAGVPFTLRSGKALGRDRGEVVVTFKNVPDAGHRAHGLARNVLRLGLMAPSLRLSVNLLAPGFSIHKDELEIPSLAEGRPAYANLLLAMLKGNAMLTIRDDEAEESWRIVDPVLQAWVAGAVPLLDYVAGSDGPPGATP
jgi:glucose-6-phosphate 1-dehydrogenase